ncbi:TolC family protein [Azoarcus olearius]|uniref:TolC family protein n=1 Tax=Azoarcus sp. (strain BH72) TaxID=418699 RepID=UPI000A0613D5|nr:TolC family protein [Azoarcus olearius]
MRTQPWMAACAIAGSMICCAALAQTTAPRVGLARALDAAWQRTQAGTEAQVALARAEAEQAAADSLLAEPPALELSHRSDRWHDNKGARENEVGLALPLWLPGQRSARQAAAEAGRALAHVGEDADRLRLAGEVREAAWALAGLDAEAAVAEAQLRYLRALAADVERRVQAGELARTDAIAARAEALAAQAAFSEARERRHAAMTRWQTLTGLDAPADPREPDTVPAAAGDDGLPATHPGLRLAAQAVEHARRGVEVARTDRAAPPELTLSYRREVGESGAAAERSITVGLRVPFGTDARNRPLAAAAQGELAQAQVAELRLRQQLAGDLLVARGALQAAQAQAEAARERAGLLRERAQLIDKAFRAGEAALPELLLAASAATQGEAGRARQDAALGLARARLQQVSGILP